MDIFLVLLGFAGLLAGGEALVRGAVSLAQRLAISPMVIGLTIVGFGTSTPELVTSVQAALVGSPGIAVGNVVGSNIANILLILGLAALIRPMRVDPAALRRDGSVMVAAALICAAVVLSGAMARPVGGLFVAALALYLVATLWVERRRPGPAGEVYAHEAEVVSLAPQGLGKALALLLGGVLLTIVGARFLVTGAVALATSLGLSEAVIGLTVVAVGTSMPELVTSVVAARRNQSDVALGNVIGSNIFNVLGILGTTAVVMPITIPAQIATFDIWIMLIATAALVVFARTGWRIGRREGLVLLAGYGAYLVTLLRAL